MWPTGKLLELRVHRFVNIFLFRVILDEAIRGLCRENCRMPTSEDFGEKMNLLKEVIQKVESMGEIVFNISSMWGKWTLK